MNVFLFYSRILSFNILIQHNVLEIPEMLFLLQSERDEISSEGKALRKNWWKEKKGKIKIAPYVNGPSLRIDLLNVVVSFSLDLLISLNPSQLLGKIPLSHPLSFPRPFYPSQFCYSCPSHPRHDSTKLGHFPMEMEMDTSVKVSQIQLWFD